TPKTFNPLEDRRRKWFGQSTKTKLREKDGRLVVKLKDKNSFSNKRGNIWLYDVGYNKSATDNIAFQHPATFPEKLALDHIVSWSNEGDLILDPFLGSGTTCYSANKLNRKSIGIELSEKYCEIAKNRLAQSVMKL
ncbi:MAG: site-specific DNA-methyltransferase, partial [Candidatus Omnitrophica bacterium]|nr:site-specific DNA-methyltransferase [Candidatus Omnitrophota bacterium]